MVPPAAARRGAFIARNVVLMPSYVNIGAYVDEGTMVDTWATVGSCAQIGRNVHLSGGVGIGGVLEPLQANPTIIEDNCFIGARSEIVEGVIVEENSVISMGVYIGQSTKIYDRATGEVRYGARPAGQRRGLRQPARGGRQVQSLLRRDRQAGGREDPREDENQRVAEGRLNLPGARVMFIEKLLQLMAEKKASDIFISAGSPISIKIKGNIMPVNPQPMDAETTRKIAFEMLTPHQAEIFERDLELNFSKPMPGLGNFRVNLFWQKGAVSAVIRFITSDIPKIADLNLPPMLSTLVMEKRGLILMVGATGSGKVDDARLHARLPQLGVHRAHPDDRGPGRVRLHAEEVDLQPARGRATTRARSTTR